MKKNLNTFVETFISTDIFSLTSSFFYRTLSPNKLPYLTIQTRTTAFSKQVLVPKRDKKKYQHSLYPVNHLYQRKSPSASLVSKEIETDFRSSSFFQKARKVPEVADLSIVAGLGGFVTLLKMIDSPPLCYSPKL